jgi:hypothetical protein
MFFNERCRDDLDINITNQNVNTNMNENYLMNTMDGYEMQSQPMMGSVMSPIVEPGRERIVNRTFIHEVPHICPMNTRIINNHIYRHTYQPRYTCCEENVVTQEQCGSCCNFN